MCLSGRLYGIKCAKCNIGFSKNDFVMRARSKVYHIECFRCVACSRQLIPGDEFALREDGLFCRADHDVVERASLVSGDPLSPLHPARPLQMAGKVSELLLGNPLSAPCDCFESKSYVSVFLLVSHRCDDAGKEKQSFRFDLKVCLWTGSAFCHSFVFYICLAYQQQSVRSGREIRLSGRCCQKYSKLSRLEEGTKHHDCGSAGF